MTDEYVWPFQYMVRMDLEDFGWMTVSNPYPDEVPEGHVLMLPPDFWQFMEDHPEIELHR